MKIKSALFILLNIIIGLIIVFLLSALYYQFFYDNRIYPNISVGEIRVGGMTQSEAENALAENLNNLYEKSVIFQTQTNSAEIVFAGNQGNIATGFRNVYFDHTQSAKNAYAYGRHTNFFAANILKLKALIFGAKLTWTTEIESEIIIKELQNTFAALETPMKDADLVYDNGEFKLIPEQSGLKLDYQNALQQFEKFAKNGESGKINIQSIITEPNVYSQDAVGSETKALELLNHQPLKITFTNPSEKDPQEIIFNTSTITNFIGLDNNAQPVFKIEKIITYLTKEVSPKINQTPIEPRFIINGQKVSSFSNGTDGQIINIQSAATIIKTALDNNTETANITLEVASPKSRGSINDFNIQELIGEGTSSFAGSPKNRRHNIATGAAAINGLLIAPDEEFSLVKALGEIDGTTGYLPELVIKDNRTIPEYGGGLCQVATTLFRAAMYSGLPITERRNHSYRVSYYEPAGMDAAVYIPNPDVKFINDTNNYILIQTRIENDSLIFSFWGKEDDRKVEISKPVVYNIVKPAATKIIESPDLKPGEKKCTESAHAGADAYFDYKVTYSPDNIKDVRFSSHYVPWQAVCLIGISATSTATTTISQ